MLRRRIYYQFKPFIPRALRMAVRGWLARRKRPQVGDVWPVLPGSEIKPVGWTGWPDGKQFALVLTHDVESQVGLDRVVRLAELEMKHGLRSSFNFIPEGSYTVPDELRAWLTDRDFEVAVHDLRHDGRLYESHQAFSENAQRINGYLRDWNAVGFRSGFMFHNLEWLGELDVVYDLSTFDTDPFEPQPDGVETIFPFFVPRDQEGKEEIGDRRSEMGNQSQPSAIHNVLRTPNSHLPSPNAELRASTRRAELRTPTSDLPLDIAARPRGYVELPYTLPQDSTLFLLLREPTIEIWTRKLDWIATHGGMALMNVHPDYLDFAEEKNGSGYGVHLYENLLEHVQNRHGGQYWAARPCEVAQHVLAFKTNNGNDSRKRHSDPVPANGTGSRPRRRSDGRTASI